MKPLKKSPLLLWITCYILGFFCSPFLLLFFSTVFIAFFVATRFVRQLNILWLNEIVMFGLIFIALGLVSMSNVTNEAVIKNNQGNQFFVGRVVEQLNESDHWKNNVIEIERVWTKDKRWIHFNEHILAICENPKNIMNANDCVLFYSKLIEIKNKNNPGEFNLEQYWRSKGVRFQGFVYNDNSRILSAGSISWFDTLLEKIRLYSNSVIDQKVGGEYGDLIKAIVLGNRSDLAIETKLAFMNAGAMHMLAVSGLHVGIIAFLLLQTFKLVFAGKFHRLSVVSVVVLLWFYAFITGLSPSITRAVIMFSVLIISQLIYRQHNVLNSLAFAAFVILIYNPLTIFDIGFQLSFLAMLGIFIAYPFLKKLIYLKQKWLVWIWEGTAVGLAAQLFTVPVSLYYFSQFPNYFMLTNIGIMIISGIILGAALLLLILGKLPLLSTALGYGLLLISMVFILFVQQIENLPGSLALGFSPSIYWLAFTYLGIGVGLYLIQSNRMIPVLCIAIFSLFWVQYERYKNLSRKELVVFNSNQTVLLFNVGSKHICVYSGDEIGAKQAKFLVRDYQKIHPSEVEFVPLKYEEIKLKSNKNEIRLKYNRFFYELDLNTEKYAIVVNNRFDEHVLVEKRKIIQNEKIELDNSPFHHLKNGSLRIALK